jgi:hypothetical protein
MDADGHVLERLGLWEKYIDPAFRDRAPRGHIDTRQRAHGLRGANVPGRRPGQGAILQVELREVRSEQRVLSLLISPFSHSSNKDVLTRTQTVSTVRRGN